MRRGASLLFATLACTVGLFGCSWGLITLDPSDDGTIQTIYIGDSLTIELTGNASTGYQWIRSEPTSFIDVPLEIVSEGEYEVHDPDVCGGPGTFSFTYQAIDAGLLTLRYTYRRPWEEDVADTASFTIWVKPR